nr:DEAD/DEAH box helicase [Streptacidiphilus anmyonensis]
MGRTTSGRGTALTTFRELGILPETAEALEAVGIITPFPIQEMTLPVAMTGHDVIGQAKTGTGKTLGFGLPIIDSVRVAADVDAGRLTAAELPTAPQALVVVPTRELCTQVTNDLLVAGKVRNVRVLSIYGGRGYETQIEALERGVDVIVGTPGRLLDLARQKKLDLSAVRTLVLDEADEMLDLGFLPDVEKIIDLLPAQRQTMLFSATMPGAVISLARRYMNRPTHIRATQPDDQGATVANTSQHIYRAHSLDKVEMIARILQAEGRNLAMIFCRTKRTTADVAEQLTKRGFAAGAVHGDLGQGAREQALRAFRNGKVDILVCTDVAARGIDVEGVTHVINYQCPEEEKTYLHRIGRTGRAGASGTAVTLVDWDDIPRWQLINKALELSFNDPEETYSSSAHLYEQLNIAPGTKGVLPRAERTRAGLDAEEIEDLGEPGGGRRRGASASKPAGRGEGRTRDRDRDRDAEQDSERPTGRRERDRKRRRTRGGQDAPDAAASAVTEGQAAPAAQPALDEAAESLDAPARRRRRRTRSGDQAEVAAEAVVEAAEAVVAAAAESIVEAAPSVTEEAPAPRKRTRTAKKTVTTDAAETAEAVDTLEVVETPVAVEEAPAPRKRTRATQKTVAEAPVVETPVVETAETAAPAPVEEAPAPRKRTRATKKAVVAEAPAAVVAEAVAPVAEETPAPRRRTRAAKATAEVAPEAPATAEAPATEEAPAPRKRTRTAKKTVTPTRPRPPRPSEVVKAPVAVEKTPAPASVEPVAAVAGVAPRKRRRATSGVTDAAAKAAGQIAPQAEEEAPAPVESPTLPAPRKRRRATSGVTDASARAAERVSVAATRPAEAEVPAQRGEATPIAAEEEPPKRKRRSVRLAEAAAASAAAEAAEAAAPKRARTSSRARTRS